MLVQVDDLMIRQTYVAQYLTHEKRTNYHSHLFLQNAEINKLIGQYSIIRYCSFAMIPLFTIAYVGGSTCDYVMKEGHLPDAVEL